MYLYPGWSDATETPGKKPVSEVDMLDPKVLPHDALLKLPPLIIGHIRWNKNIGNPSGDPCSGFRILVEEHTATEFRFGPGGIIEPEPGTGIWKTLTDAPHCTSLSSTDGTQEVMFRVNEVHFNAFPDGFYRITPQLTVAWHSLLAPATPGFRRIEPVFWDVVLNEGANIQSVGFEVSWFPYPFEPEWQAKAISLQEQEGR